MDDGVLMLVDGEYRLQTQESAEWEKDFRTRRSRILGDDARIASDRTTEFRGGHPKGSEEHQAAAGREQDASALRAALRRHAPAADTDAVPVWVRDEWSTSEKTVRDEAQAAGVDSPIVFVLLPRQEAEELKYALASRRGGQDTLDARPSTQTTAEGAEARQAMDTRLSTEDGRVHTIVGGILNNARVFQGGGNEIAESSAAGFGRDGDYRCLGPPVPQLRRCRRRQLGQGGQASQRRRGRSVVGPGLQRRCRRAPGCKEVRAFLGGNKKGGEVRKQFMGVGYGWPQDAVDGALLALVAGGYVRAEKGSQTVPAKQIVQSQIGVLEFRSETKIITANQRIGVRKLIREMGLPFKNGEEAEAIPRVLQRLVDLAVDAGGPPPLSERPSTAAVQESAGVERQRPVRGRLRSPRQPAGQLRRLEQGQVSARGAQAGVGQAQAAACPRRWPAVVAAVQPQVDAIQQQRLLLAEPDPVKPLVEALCNDLRQALQVARQRVIETCASGNCKPWRPRPSGTSSATSSGPSCSMPTTSARWRTGHRHRRTAC